MGKKKDRRKSIAALKAEVDEWRPQMNKTFIHTKTGEAYQTLFICFDENTNEAKVAYVLVALPWLKFSRPPKEFFSKFHEMGTVADDA